LGLVRFLVSSGNVPFAIALGIAFLFVLLQVSGVLGLIAGGGEGHDADHGDAGGDAHDAGGEHDADADADGDNDADHDADHDEGRSWTSAALGPLGVGKLPFSLIWQTYLVVFAAAGLALNARYFEVAGGAPLVSLAWSVPASLLSGYVAVALLARLLGPVFAPKEQEATSRAELVGQIGVVISSNVDAEFGEIRIRDKTGHDLRVVCKLAPPGRGAKGKPARTTVRENQSVVVVEYEGGELFVAPFEEEEEGAVLEGAPPPNSPPGQRLPLARTEQAAGEARKVLEEERAAEEEASQESTGKRGAS
jgi:membrane protein implicated in regulation of membrane protease activity